jgi:hypothetical protein
MTLYLQQTRHPEVKDRMTAFAVKLKVEEFPYTEISHSNYFLRLGTC